MPTVAHSKFGESTAPSPPFNQCPAVGADTSCGVLIVVSDVGVQIFVDPTQGPFDGTDDTLVDVVNSSSSNVGRVALSANAPVFGFDGDGLCTFPQVPGCPFGPTGYEGPLTSFTSLTSDGTGGTVIFSSGLATGASAYFSLEAAIAPTTLVTPGPTQGNQQAGGSPDMRQGQAPCQGQPVNCINGEFWHTFSDIAAVPTRGLPLAFSRTYSSLEASISGSLGNGWTHNYAMSLTVDAAGNATLHEDNGSIAVFKPALNGGYTAPTGIESTLARNPDNTFTKWPGWRPPALAGGGKSTTAKLSKRRRV